jgi:deazaflavin-dependent oxidoreductase (nitroreductase family)
VTPRRGPKAHDFNRSIIDEFRANQGRVGGPFEGGRLILLTTTGARSGEPHTNPLGYLPDQDRILVIGSAGGAAKHPDWYHNLLADPRCTVEDGVFTYPAAAEVLTGAERDALFARAVEANPGWATYQAQTSRVLPVVALRNTSTGPPPMNATTLADGLVAIHNAFRRELDTIRREIEAGGVSLGAQLRVNCLTVCGGLHVHHMGEDGALFPALVARQPALASTVDRLREQHESIAARVGALRALVRNPADAAGVRAELGALIAELDAHLAEEEAELLAALRTF